MGVRAQDEEERPCSAVESGGAPFAASDYPQCLVDLAAVHMVQATLMRAVSVPGMRWRHTPDTVMCWALAVVAIHCGRVVKGVGSGSHTLASDDTEAGSAGCERQLQAAPQHAFLRSVSVTMPCTGAACPHCSGHARQNKHCHVCFGHVCMCRLCLLMLAAQPDISSEAQHRAWCTVLVHVLIAGT